MCKMLRILALSLLTALPCAAADEKAPVAGAAPVWPAPPQQARIRHLQSVAKPEDLGRRKGLFRRIYEFFRGTEREEIRKPMAVAVDGEGRLYVADPPAKCVHLFDPEAGKYDVFFGAGRHDFAFPIGVDAEGSTVYVVDSASRRVYAMDRDGDLLRIFGGEELVRPTGVVADRARGRLYVVDTPAHDIKVYDLDNGTRLKSLGGRGVEPGRFNYPTYAAVDRQGRLYVTDSLNARVQTLSADGEPLTTVGSFGDGTGNFSAPKGVGVDSEGHIYVADAAFDNVQVFDGEGRLLLYFGTTGQEAGQFWMPTALYIDHRDRIYVADSYNKRVQVFQYLGGRDK